MTEATKKPRKRKATGPFSNELLDQLLAQVSGKDAESLLGESGLIGQLKKQLAERMLAAELTHHLANEEPDEGAGNHRNGSSPKTVLTPNGALDLSIPRCPVQPSTTLSLWRQAGNFQLKVAVGDLVRRTNSYFCPPFLTIFPLSISRFHSFPECHPNKS